MTWKRITGIIFPMTIAGCPRANFAGSKALGPRGASRMSLPVNGHTNPFT
ncbi:MAG: hypothetical protein METHP_00097 [Methanoregula sp. SKADARSKE-2]|nr:MAG: hypothetical protein METHP_00097 [Methanoregula sp. SKADARSKE-2]